jgi:hypothetical protein
MVAVIPPSCGLLSSLDFQSCRWGPLQQAFWTRRQNHPCEAVTPHPVQSTVAQPSSLWIPRAVPASPRAPLLAGDETRTRSTPNERRAVRTALFCALIPTATSVARAAVTRSAQNQRWPSTAGLHFRVTASHCQLSSLFAKSRFVGDLAARLGNVVHIRFYCPEPLGTPPGRTQTRSFRSSHLPPPTPAAHSFHEPCAHSPYTRPAAGPSPPGTSSLRVSCVVSTA